ncbi:hypothetical protein BDZ90DRAFT_259495 [Jaminaea rosea]|uniref:Cysteine-rich PDZ-binding protein n=1 Tax=Jaminaea rosea TaxID=1569628 RepID=A0A316UT28_9BASI|nr:hypothetical protein BDZ90DRAFT_259495 [Jaminaea rosea]PWN28456.1 hypothetical protein BDZ90DRAFT_259495 [Jaminaea rosea]
MVCATCEKKQARALAAPDPFRNRTASGSLMSTKAGSSSSSSASVRPTNKLLAAKGQRFNPMANQCKICKSPTSAAGGAGGGGAKGAQYCSSCAFKRGCCAICGKVMLDIKKGGHKMSS